MFKKILIANRGEIACRIIRTAKELDIATVAVYSTADAHALHVQLAEEAYCIGPAPSSESYLRGEAILQVAKTAQAEAIHPGYGFLSENADFVERCAEEGIVFIGPPAAAIRAMGEKNTAKQLMQKAGVPVIPGYHGEAQDLASLQKAADTMGYPVLIKAVAGGGGKGMRVVTQAVDFPEALSAAQQEAKASFADDRVLLEKYLAQARHVEMQVFADAHGHALYLFERDCSLQRRHQKIIEEAPAPHLSAATRQAMGEAAVNAMLAIDYRGAGTIEFLLTPEDQFYFMEMNTRLQVEHPVTEKITGLDLVAWQLQVAAGEVLPITEQADLHIHGHAVEARIYAEDPQKDFMPSVGLIAHLHMPTENDHIRIDSGVRAGDAISVYYDPLIAKLIAWDVDRQQALTRLSQALVDFHVVGVQTNIGLLKTIVDNPSFLAAELDTSFIARHADQLLQPAPPSVVMPLLFAALAIIRHDQENIRQVAQASADSYSPWFKGDNWRLNAMAERALSFRQGEKTELVTVQQTGDLIQALAVDGIVYVLDHYEIDHHQIQLHIHEQTISGAVYFSGRELHVFHQGQHSCFVIADDFSTPKEGEGAHTVVAPMPGALTEIFVSPGQAVKKGDRLLTVEAMKMQHTVYAAVDGVVAEIFYQKGDVLEEGVQLISWASPST